MVIGYILISFYPAQARRMKGILVINPDMAVSIESFTQLTISRVKTASPILI